jgi:regulator of protease activity HflC (stomatin/prohibitin superfamily)
MEIVGLGTLILVGLVGLALAGLRIINQQSAAVVETFGKYSRTLTPGLNWIIPVVQQIVAKVDLRLQELRSEVEVKSIDNVFVKLPVTLMVQAMPDRASQAHYRLVNPREQITTWALNVLRATTAGLKLSDLFEDRETLAAEVRNSLEARMKEYGYEIISVLVDQPSVSEEVQLSFNRVVASKREREAAEQEAAAKKIRILAEAEAEAESQILRARGIAEARGILAKSLASAVSEAKEQGISEHDIMHLLLETNRLDTIKYAAEHGKLVVMDVRDGGRGMTPTVQI